MKKPQIFSSSSLSGGFIIVVADLMKCSCKFILYTRCSLYNSVSGKCDGISHLVMILVLLCCLSYWRKLCKLSTGASCTSNDNI